MEDALEKISRLEFQAQSQFVPQVVDQASMQRETAAD